MAAIRVTTRTFRGRPSAAIAGMTLGGLAVVTAAVSVGLHPLLATGLFLAVLVLLAMRLGGDTEYLLEDAGVRRRWRSLADARRGREPREDFLAWDELRSFRLDRDLTRSLREVEFLELHRGRGAAWIVNDRQDPAGFVAFRDAFLGRMGGSGQVTRRPGFYRRPLGRLASGLAVLATLALGGLLAADALGLFETGLLDGRSLFRLLFLCVPGSAYMAMRSFGRGR